MQLALSDHTFFQENALPSDTRLAGWAALVQAFGIKAPVSRPASVSEKHVRGTQRQDGIWTVFDKRLWPRDTFADHLTFALRHEDMDVLLLKRVFAAVPKEELEAFVRAAPTGIYARRAWYWYESLTGQRLAVEDAPNATAIDLLEPKKYFTGKGRLSRRHRLRDNMLGNARFCPLIRRTQTLTNFIERNLAERARDTIGRTGNHLISRAASFMLLADSRASFEIEGERPTNHRLRYWGRAVLQAGKNRLTLEEIIRLHDVLIEDKRFTKAGLRTDGGFLGERDHNGDPVPEFIGARFEDLPELMADLLAANGRMGQDAIDPVLQATATAFGFVYVHPFEDGNGRLHRCLIHHVLAERKFTPPGMVFPVSSAMLDRIDDYQKSLQTHSAPLLDVIDWEPTAKHNVRVLNDTADLYRYFDCTEAAEFLYSCVARTVEHDLPREIDYLRRHDDAMRRVMEAVEMPDRLAEDLIMFIRQNNGALSKNRRLGEFRQLRDDEVTSLEGIVRDAFADFDDGSMVGTVSGHPG